MTQVASVACDSGSAGSPTASAASPAPVLITTDDGLAAALQALRSAPTVGLDCETTGLDPHRDRGRLIQLAAPGAVYLVDCFRVDPAPLAALLAAGPRFVGHNLKFDLQFLLALGLPVPKGDRLFDTMLAAQLLGAGTAEGYPNRCGLADVAERFLGR